MQREERDAQRLARVVFVVVVAASLAAFVVTQRLKHLPTEVQDFEMTPTFKPSMAFGTACRGKLPRQLVGAMWPKIEYLSFRTAKVGIVTVEIVDVANHDVATIVQNLHTEGYKQLSVCWNGHRGLTQTGPLAPPGNYRMRVILRNNNRPAIYSPASFRLEA